MIEILLEYETLRYYLETSGGAVTQGVLEGEYEKTSSIHDRTSTC